MIYDIYIILYILYYIFIDIPSMVLAYTFCIPFFFLCKSWFRKKKIFISTTKQNILKNALI